VTDCPRPTRGLVPSAGNTPINVIFLDPARWSLTTRHCIAKRRPQRGLDVVPASWTMGAEGRRPRAARQPCHVSVIDLRELTGDGAPPPGGRPQAATGPARQDQPGRLRWPDVGVRGGVEPPTFRFQDYGHRAGPAREVYLPAQRPAVHADGRRCTNMYETRNETSVQPGSGCARPDPLGTPSGRPLASAPTVNSVSATASSPVCMGCSANPAATATVVFAYPAACMLGPDSRSDLPMTRVGPRGVDITIVVTYDSR
jgi:hypothetical protein